MATQGYGAYGANMATFGYAQMCCVPTPVSHLPRPIPPIMGGKHYEVDIPSIKLPEDLTLREPKEGWYDREGYYHKGPKSLDLRPDFLKNLQKQREQLERPESELGQLVKEGKSLENTLREWLEEQKPDELTVDLRNEYLKKLVQEGRALEEPDSELRRLITEGKTLEQSLRMERAKIEDLITQFNKMKEESRVVERETTLYGPFGLKFEDVLAKPIRVERVEIRPSVTPRVAMVTLKKVWDDYVAPVGLGVLLGAGVAVTAMALYKWFTRKKKPTP